MSVILSRDTELYVSTVQTGFTTANTTKLSLLDGYKMTQGSTLNSYSTFRNATAPSRVETKYVKDVDLVSIDFSTYVKTKQNGGLSEPSDLILWNAFTNNGTTRSAGNCQIDFLSSSTNIFPDLYLFLNLAGDVFKVGKCYVESVTISFEIDKIVATTWKLQAIAYEKVSAPPATFLDRTEITGYLKGKLSILQFNRQVIDYNMPILGGSITLSNTIVGLSTPVVTQQLTTNKRVRVEGRSTAAEISVYLRTGKNRSLDLLSSMLSSIATINDLADIIVNLGGLTGRRLAIELPQTICSLPQLNIKDVVTTNITLSPIETAIGANDDVKIIYYN